VHPIVVEDVPIFEEVKTHDDAVELFPEVINTNPASSLPTDTPGETVTPVSKKSPPISPSHNVPRMPEHNGTPTIPSPAPFTSPTQFHNEHEIGEYLDSADLEHLPDLDTLPSLLADIYHIPIIPPADRISSTELKTKIVTTEFLQKSLGFRNIDTVLKHLKSLTQDNIRVCDTDRDPVLSRGETATLPKRGHNTKPVSHPQSFGDVFHYDIGYGNGRAVGQIHYALFIVDRKTRMKFIFGLKNLHTTTIQYQLRKFLRQRGKFPTQMIADGDFKLVGEEIEQIMEHTQISGAPSGRHSQNGLSEINWRCTCNSARNYMAEHLLPSEFWFFALRYSVQLGNYTPILQSPCHYTILPGLRHQTRPP